MYFLNGHVIAQSFHPGLIGREAIAAVCTWVPNWAWRDGSAADVLLAVHPHAAPVLLLCCERVSNLLDLYRAIGLSRWSLGATWVDGSRFVLEATAASTTYAPQRNQEATLVDRLRQLGDGLVLDPMAHDLSVLDASDAADRSAVLIAASTDGSRQDLVTTVQQRGGQVVGGNKPWLRQLLSELANGQPLQRACELAGVSRSYVYRLRHEPWFQALYDAAVGGHLGHSAMRG